jgi:hypothetical protein
VQATSMSAAIGQPARRTPVPYAGIGARRTPADVLARMRQIAAAYSRAGWTLRTGASPGADQAFLAGALAGGGHAELFLPEPGFEQQSWIEAEAIGAVTVEPRPSEAAYALAATLHPSWAELSAHEQALLARDCHQVLGADLASPARFVICWAPGGSRDGAAMFEEGTGQALRPAARCGVPVFNLAPADESGGG